MKDHLDYQINFIFHSNIFFERFAGTPKKKKKWLLGDIIDY